MKVAMAEQIWCVEVCPDAASQINLLRVDTLANIKLMNRRVQEQGETPVYIPIKEFDTQPEAIAFAAKYRLNWSDVPNIEG